jgi:hypothetical protein
MSELFDLFEHEPISIVGNSNQEGKNQTKDHRNHPHRINSRHIIPSQWKPREIKPECLSPTLSVVYMWEFSIRDRFVQESAQGVPTIFSDPIQKKKKVSPITPRFIQKLKLT